MVNRESKSAIPVLRNVPITISTASRYCSNYTTAFGDCDSVKGIAYFMLKLGAFALFPWSERRDKIENEVDLHVHFFRITHGKPKKRRHISHQKA
jgi:hypothetical protein